MRAKSLLITLTMLGTLGLATAPRALVGAAREHGPLEPHVIMVLARAAGGAGFCSGAIVASDIVLTAAHCVRETANTAVHWRDEGGRSSIAPVATIATHPDFHPDAIKTRQRSIDLALLRLVEPLPARFTPAPLARDRTVALGDRFRVAGFGLAREGVGASGGVFRWGPLIARAPLSEVLLWAEDPAQGGFGACTGDSGGPIFADGDDFIVAVVAWTTGTKGKHCGALTQGALVAPQQGWIDSVLARWR